MEDPNESQKHIKYVSDLLVILHVSQQQFMQRTVRTSYNCFMVLKTIIKTNPLAVTTKEEHDHSRDNNNPSSLKTIIIITKHINGAKTEHFNHLNCGHYLSLPPKRCTRVMLIIPLTSLMWRGLLTTEYKTFLKPKTERHRNEDGGSRVTGGRVLSALLIRIQFIVLLILC